MSEREDGAGQAPQVGREYWNVSSLVGRESGLPLVAITPGEREAVTITAEEARDLALNLLSAADAAESDLAVVRYLVEEAEVAEADALAVLRGMRVKRTDSWVRQHEDQARRARGEGS